MRGFFVVFAALFGATWLAPSAKADTTCLVCTLVITLVEQNGHKGPGPFATNPDKLCQDLKLCDGTCSLFEGTWPVKSPDFPTDGIAIDDSASPRGGNSSASDVGTLKSIMRQSQDQVAQLQALQSYFVRMSDATDESVPVHEKQHIAVAALYFFAQERDRRAEAGLPQLDFLEAVSFYSRAFVTAARRRLRGESIVPDDLPAVASLPCDDWTDISCDIHRLTKLHLPMFDEDEDNYAGGYVPIVSDGLRGAVWRGRDCNDTNDHVRPGRAAQRSGWDASYDSNCNGIFGADQHGPYEQQLCSGENAPMGVAILGDSAGAHFHAPPQYLNAYNFDVKGIVESVTNEMDWSACSWTTGFRDEAGCPESFGVPMKSIYQRMVEKNRCMHRDFQNIGVNGARVDTMAGGIMDSLARDQAADQPMLVFWALIGNDVCNGHPGMSHMTTPSDFEASVLTGLDKLDQVLPNGSHVAFLPLAQGTVLYDTMHNRTHPLGVDYEDLYDALSCNGANPCWGWLNSNATWRERTQQRANELSAVYEKIIREKQGSYKHFDLHRVTVQWDKLIKQWIAKGNDPRHIIEPVDGFHPSQAGQQLLAEVVWNDLEQNVPHWLPQENPNNARIQSLFGGQGGY